MKNIGISLIFLFCKLTSASVSSDMILIPAGTFKPFYKKEMSQEIKINSFYMDIYPVNIADFNKFLKNNPEFKKSKISANYADERYLENWKSDLVPEKELKKMYMKPVVNISWFVARRYCESQGKRLPTLNEWEYASDASDAKVIDQILKWYEKKASPDELYIGRKDRNKFGLFDMHGLIWEWIEDFNTVMLSSDSRTKGEQKEGLFCGGGSLSAEDSKEYATFMRYALRGSLQGTYTTHSLGFRCVKDK